MMQVVPVALVERLDICQAMQIKFFFFFFLVTDYHVIDSEITTKFIEYELQKVSHLLLVN